MLHVGGVVPGLASRLLDGLESPSDQFDDGLEGRVEAGLLLQGARHGGEGVGDGTLLPVEDLVDPVELPDEFLPV